MCNCGHEDDTISEEKRLRKQAAMCGAFVAILSGFPAIFATTGRSHMALVVAIIAVQIMLIARAAFLIRKRRNLLSSGA